MDKLNIKIVASEIEQFTNLKDITTSLNYDFVDQFETIESNFNTTLTSKPSYDRKGIIVIGDVRSVQENEKTVQVYSSNYKSYTILTNIVVGGKESFLILEFLILESIPLIIRFKSKDYLTKK